MLLATACALTPQSPPEMKWIVSVAFAGMVRKRYTGLLRPIYRILAGRLNVVGDGVCVDSAIASGNEVDCVGGLRRHGPEAVHRAAAPDLSDPGGPPECCWRRRVR